MQLQLFTISLAEAYMLSPKVKHFVFQADLNAPFSYQPGQFITIHFEYGGKILKRSYSIANIPLQNNRIEFAAGYVENGPGTELLFNLQPGDTISINGPFGRLILKEDLPKRYVLVSTSTGVTPYRAMLAELTTRLSANPNLQVVILQGVQYASDVLYADEFLAFAQQFPQQVIFRAQLSREEGALKAHEHKGYVQHAYADLALNPSEDVVYLCGNPGMIDASFEALKAVGFLPNQIIREKYISSR